MERSDFRIIERQNSFGKSEFTIQHKVHKMVGGFFGLFGGTMVDVWEDFYVEVYENYVNDQHRFRKISIISPYLSNAEDKIEFYIEHFRRKPIEYRGYKLIPIIYYNGGGLQTLSYYDPKSFTRRGSYNYGWRTYQNEWEFKKYVDNKLDSGKILNIHK